MTRRFPRTRTVALAVVAFVGLWLLYRLVVVQPSNERNWEYGMEVLPHITITNDIVAVEHVRDFRWTPDGISQPAYVDRSFDVTQLDRVWFVEEPFTIPPFYGFGGVAHTYFVFDFKDQPPVAISVEARRERGEAYDALRGVFNDYELMYVWGTEHDVTGRRAVVEGNRLYMYPLIGSADSARRLFLNLAEATRQLETQPRFYNSLTSNCTNELARVANQTQPGAIPPNIALILPGYSDQLLYDRGFIPNDAPLNEVQQWYAAADAVVATIDQPDFSRALRQRLDAQAASAALSVVEPIQLDSPVSLQFVFRLSRAP
jgi:Domain of unknown function (DUF4105)